MASLNPFDLLVDDESDDPQLIAAQKLAAAAAAAAAEAAEAAEAAKTAGEGGHASKHLPPKHAVGEARNEAQRGGGRGDGRFRGREDGRGGRGRGDVRGRGGRGYDRDFGDNENSNSTYNGYSGGFGGTEGEDGGKVSGRRGGYNSSYGGSRGGRRGDFGNGNVSYGGERLPRREFERHSGSGRVNDVKREGAGNWNWGTPSDEIVGETEVPVNEVEKSVGTEKQSEQETVENDKKDAPMTESDEKKEREAEQKRKEQEAEQKRKEQEAEEKRKEREAEEKKMTLDVYEKVLEEKRKASALLALKSEERKVDPDKELKAMQQLLNKKNDEEVFVKLGKTDKDKRKEVAVGDKAKKSVSINEFLKPAEGKNYYPPGGRGGRGGGGGGRGGRGGNGGNYSYNSEAAPSIEDVRHFPTLGAK